MTYKDRGWQSPTSPNESLFFNAFADAEPSTTAHSSTSFMIPGHWQQDSTPRKRKGTLRRRGSNSAQSSPSTSPNAHIHLHSRSHTEQPIRSYFGPLGSPTFRSDSANGINAGNTRPHLSRLLSPWESPAGSDGGDKASSSDDGSVKEQPPPPEEEKTVLVHEVSSNDSLAGVALKHGITMSELRKANQLWASDSIHLRKVLYIPLDSKKRNNRKPLIDLEPALETSSEQSLSHDKSNSPTIRRIPASQLSFFPPSTKSPAPDLMESEDFSDNRRSYSTKFPSKRTGSGTNTPSQPSRTLTSIFTAFPIPIAPSTRDTIVSRLSFDSERSSIVDDQEHELDEVRSSTVRPRLRLTSAKFADNPSHSSHSHDSTRAVSPQRNASPPNFLDVPDQRKSWIHRDITGTRAAVRTVQPEPSPAMRVPSLILKSKSESGADEQEHPW